MPDSILSRETHYQLLRELDANPNISQRELSRTLGVSLGKVNYCLKALMEKGLIKAENFRKSNNKLAYAYVLTPHGIQKRAEITIAFLRRKQAEYERLTNEIEMLRAEVKAQQQAAESGQVPKP